METSLFLSDYFIDPSKRVYWLYLLSSLCLAVIYLYSRPKRLSFAFSGKVWLHPSAKLDYIYFVLSIFIKAFLIAPLIIGADAVATYTYTFFAANVEYPYIDIAPSYILALYTVTLFVVSDLTRYWLHRWMHTIGWLWRFHEVHHSARVLNPLTFYRVHPVENILFGLRYSISAGFVSGIFMFVFGEMVEKYEMLGVNIIVLFFLALGSNLRHSHVRLGFYGWLEHIIVSPAQHQIHHSVSGTDKNFGGSLAVWDWMFNTIQTTSESKYSRFGLSRQRMQNYQNISDLLLQPFRRNL